MVTPTMATATRIMATPIMVMGIRIGVVAADIGEEATTIDPGKPESFTAAGNRCLYNFPGGRLTFSLKARVFSVVSFTSGRDEHFV